MSKKIIDEINQAFAMGYIPPKLNYAVHPVEEIDWSKVQYNSFYKTYDFAHSKFPAGCDSIKGFENVIKACIPKISPLEEIELKQKLPLDEIVEKIDEALETLEKRYNGCTDKERFDRQFEYVDGNLCYKENHIERENEYNNSLE